MTVQESNTNSVVNLIIGLSLFAFVGLIAIFVLKMMFALAPFVGFMVAVGGGIWYFRTESEHYKLRALQTTLAGIALMIVFGAIF